MNKSNIGASQTGALYIENGANVKTIAALASPLSGNFFLGTGGQSFDGSASTAGVLVYDNLSNDNIVTGSGNDYVFIYGNDTVITGAGNDVLEADMFSVSPQNSNSFVSLGAGADRLLLNNIEIQSADVTTVTVTDFNVGADVISSNISGASFPPLAFVSASTAFKVASQVAGNVIEILSQGTGGVQIATPTGDASLLASLSQVLANGGTGADIGNGNYTVVGYNGSTAYIYHLTINGTNGTAGGDDVVELVGILQGVGADSLSSVNFV